MNIECDYNSFHFQNIPSFMQQRQRQKQQMALQNRIEVEYNTYTHTHERTDTKERGRMVVVVVCVRGSASNAIAWWRVVHMCNVDDNHFS